MMSIKYRERITTYLSQRFDFPEEQVALMLPGFMSTLSSHMERLAESLEENKFTSMVTAGHTIKGAFLNLGLSECAETALHIEQSARNSDDSVDYTALVASLRLIVNDIINEE